MRVDKDILEIIHKRNIRRRGKKNINCAIIAESGSGKSYAGLRFSELYYSRYMDAPFTVNNIVFTISEFLQLVKVLPPCSFIIFDDAGLKYSSVRWFEELNQILGWTLQSYRWKIINVLFTIPVLKWLDRIGRGMLHARIDMISPGYGIFKRVSYSQDRDQSYTTRILGLEFSMPNKELRRAYENKKQRFLTREYNIYYSQAKRREGKQLSVDELTQVVLDSPLDYQIKGRFNARLIQSNLYIAKERAYQILAQIVKMKEGK